MNAHRRHRHRRDAGTAAIRDRRLVGVPRARWPRSLISVALLLPLLTAKGQDALYNAISLSGTIAAQSNPATPPPDTPHLGPVQLALGVYANSTYNDNINGSQSNPESDFIFQGGANLGLNWLATDRSDLQFATGIGYIHYLKYSANNGMVITPGSALTYSLSWNDLALTPYDQISYTRQVTSEAALANLATQPQFDNTAGIRAEWDPGHWILQASYGHDIFLSDNANDYLNRASEYFYTSAGWRFAKSTQVGVEASDSLAAYQLASQGNTDSQSVGAYVQWQILQSLNFTVRGGPTFYQFSMPVEDGGNSSLTSYYVSLATTEQLTDFLSQSLQINRSVQKGANAGSSYVQQLTAGYSISWALTRRISLAASVTYDDGQQPLVVGYLLGIIPIDGTENYQQYSGALQASWQCTDHLAASLGYNHWLRDSNLTGRSYSANSVTLGLTYTF